MARKNDWGKITAILLSCVSIVFAGGVAFGQIQTNERDICDIKSAITKISDYIVKADKDRCFVIKREKDYAKKRKGKSKSDG